MADWERKKRDTEAGNASSMDDFWDVGKLLPDRPSNRPVSKSRPSPTAVEVDVPARDPRPADPRPADPRPMDPVPVAASPLTRTAPAPEALPAPAEYKPDGLLLHAVRVLPWQSNYHYFDNFVEDALRYAAMKPPKSAEKVAFFSYFPQYVQLNRRSTAWYLFWRENVRSGRYLDTDYAYVLLYLFELINLPTETRIEAMEYRDAMASVWMAYRRTHPQLDHYMCEWLCDYCLIHELPAPVDLLTPALDAIIEGSRLKEFYLSAAVRLPAGEGEASRTTALATAHILMRHCCQYDYRKSKFAQGEHKELFDSTIPAAVAHVLPFLLGVNGQEPAGKPAITMLESTVTRDAYTGALCSYRNKRKIEVAYTSFSRSHELRFLIGDMVKHVENRLRGWIGVRSKLSVMALPIPLRDALDAYLAPLEPPKSAVPVKKKEEPRPAYEALYDLPRKAVSLEDAAAIEAQSWETTKILVEAFEDAAEVANDVAAETAHDVRRAYSANDVAPAAQTEGNGESEEREEREESEESGEGAFFAAYTPFIKAALAGDSAALRATAKALGKMPDALADEINAITADGEIGDIILEDDGMGGYTVIEDYREQVEDLLRN